MSKKKAKKRTKVSKKSKEDLKTEYMDFVTGLKTENILGNPSEIASSDTCYTRPPAQEDTTITPIGDEEVWVVQPKHVYTDAIVDMVWGDGVDRTPARLYTHNPRMNLVQKNTARGRRIRAELLEALGRFEIDESRITYIKSKKYWCSETADVLEDFFTSYDISKDTLIFHDGGPAYKRKKVNILDTLGFKKHREYPSDVHQWLSPSDNNVHGCKSTWASQYDDFDDDVNRSLQLLHLIDLDTAKHSQYYFRRNIFQVTRGDLDQIMKG